MCSITSLNMLIQQAPVRSIATGGSQTNAKNYRKSEKVKKMLKRQATDIIKMIQNEQERDKVYQKILEGFHEISNNHFKLLNQENNTDFITRFMQSVYANAKMLTELRIHFNTRERYHLFLKSFEKNKTLSINKMIDKNDLGYVNPITDIM